MAHLPVCVCDTPVCVQDDDELDEDDFDDEACARAARVRVKKKNRERVAWKRIYTCTSVLYVCANSRACGRLAAMSSFIDCGTG